MDNKKIKEWLINASNNIVHQGDSQDVHIDEIADFEIYDRNRLFDDILEFAKSLKTEFSHFIRTDCKLFLYIPLDSNYKTIMGVPRNAASLISSIDLSYPPELVLYKKFEDNDFNQVELYKSCLPFETKYSNLIEIVYRELRSYEELVNNEEYRREIHLNII